MKEKNLQTDQGPYWKIAACIALSMIYFLMLAYPFGVSMHGYMWHKVIIAMAIFFAISIPAWIINIKNEFFNQAEETATEEKYVSSKSFQSSSDLNPIAAENENVFSPLTMSQARIGELAASKKWLSSNEINQILFCQNVDDKSRFGEVAIKRNYLSSDQVSELLDLQAVNA